MSNKMFQTWGKNYLREVEDRLWRDHCYERKNKIQTSASRESEEGKNQIQMSTICPKETLIEKIKSEINSALGGIEKFEEENGADLSDVNEYLEEALRAVSELVAVSTCDKEEPPVDPAGEVAPPPAPPEEGE